jgi:hypothetical protein
VIAGGEKLIKKILAVVLSMLMIAIVASPLVSTATAGKGQEKQDFVLYMEGAVIPPPDKIIVTNNGIIQYKGAHWGITGDYWVEVDGDPYYPTGYEDTMMVTLDTRTGNTVVHIKESIQFADGTIEITVVDKTVDGVTEGTFTGIGTGSLAGVHVHGQCDDHDMNTITRPGIVMGWPF